MGKPDLTALKEQLRKIEVASELLYEAGLGDELEIMACTCNCCEGGCGNIDGDRILDSIESFRQKVASAVVIAERTKGV